MWIETQDGELINLDNGSEIVIRPPKYDKHSWVIILNHKNISRYLAEYEKESVAREIFEEFKTKLRRCGEKIFKFKEEVEENENDG